MTNWGKELLQNETRKYHDHIRLGIKKESLYLLEFRCLVKIYIVITDGWKLNKISPRGFLLTGLNLLAGLYDTCTPG